MFSDTQLTDSLSEAAILIKPGVQSWLGLKFVLTLNGIITLLLAVTGCRKPYFRVWVKLLVGNQEPVYPMHSLVVYQCTYRVCMTLVVRIHLVRMPAIMLENLPHLA